MKRRAFKSAKRRRGVIIVLTAILFTVMLAMVAFCIDLGYVAMSKAQLQAAADSAALAAAGASSKSQPDMVAVARAFAQYHEVAGRPVQLASSDVEFGTWDAASNTFQSASGLSGTAVKVTVSADSTHGGNIPLFFGRVMGASSVSGRASAVACVNPRDICFVVDLSNSMSNDSNPGQGGNTALIQAAYNDLFGVTGTGAPRVTYDSGESAKTTSTGNIATVMDWLNPNFPNISPAPNTSDPDSVGYWTAALNSTESYHGSPFINTKSGSTVTSYKMSYKSYVTFLMYRGRNQAMGTVGGKAYYSIMSAGPDPTTPNNYKTHTETVSDATLGDVTFDNFPPSEMPTHAVRRAIISALQVIQNRNATISDPQYKDWVSIVTFDRAGAGNTLVRQPLTSSYATAMQSAVTLQACYYGDECTDSNGGLRKAYEYIRARSKGGQGRENANKVVVFLTDGLPNIYNSYSDDESNGGAETDQISAATRSHPSGWGSGNTQNGPLYQALNMQSKGWSTFAVGVGLNGSQSFMDLMAGMAGTQITKTVNGRTTTGAYDVAKDINTYETTLKGVFNRIITNPKLRLVQ
jgi:Flp pilus assembly protein TadG